jgi:hypothetical protein
LIATLVYLDLDTLINHHFGIEVIVIYTYVYLMFAATPIHDGMRTPMRDRAWNPYAPMSPPRFDHEFC